MILRLDQIKGLKVPLAITPGNCKNPVGCTVYVSMYDVLQSYNALFPINALYAQTPLSGLGTLSSPFKIAQSGATTGQALVWDGSNWVPGTVAGGGGSTDQYRSVYSYASVNSVSATSAFTSLVTYYGTYGGTLVVDAPINITTNTTVAVDIEVVKSGIFNISNTFTLTLNGNFKCPPAQKCFNYNTTGNIVFAQKSVEAIYPYWFGAIADDSTDCQPSMQKAIDVALTSNIATVKFLNGNHVISKGLVVRKLNAFVTINLIGESAFDSNSPGTSLRLTTNTSFAIGIQGARSCTIKGFYIRGLGSSYNPTIQQVIQNTDSDWATQYGRNDRYSPFGGIIIDPFTTSAPPGGGYPGFSSFYVAGGGGFSTNVLVEDVVIRYFIVGIAITPSGNDGNGSECNFNRVSIDRCQIGFATGGTQNRQDNITNSVIATNQVCIHTLKFGTQNGAFPIINTTELGFCRDMIWAGGGVGAGAISNLYSESVYRIGAWLGAGSPITFYNCQINLITQAETSINDATSVFDAPQSIVTFKGGNLGYGTARATETYIQQFVLEGTNLNGPILNHPNGGVYEDNVFYHNCKLQGLAGQYNLIGFTDDITNTDAGLISSPLVQRNQRISYYETGLNHTNYVVYDNDIDAFSKSVITDVTTVTVAGSTATFTAGFAGKYRVGDILYSFDNNATTHTGLTKACSWGIVSNVSGTSITCSNVTAGVTTGVHNIYLYEFRRFIPTCLGTFTSGSNILAITNVSTQSTTAQLFPVGARITTSSIYQNYNYGVYTGLYVVSVSGNNITLSGNVGVSGTNVEVFGYPMKATYYSFDGTWQTGSTTYRTVGYRTGDTIKFLGHAYRASAEVTLGGFTPSIKFVFKTISGTTGARPTPTIDDIGLIYANTSTNTTQWWDSTTWRETGAGSSSVTRVWIEASTGTAFDLAVSGICKDVDGTNTTFAFPSNLGAMFVYKNGELLAKTGTITTRDYNTSGTTITFATALLSTDSIQILKII